MKSSGVVVRVGAACATLATVIGIATPARAADVLVSSRFSNQVLRYDGQSGAFVGVFASGHGLANPNGIAYGPDGNLYVGLGDDAKVLRFHGLTGAYIDEFVPQGRGGLGGVRDLGFGPDGNLYVDSGTTDQVLRYNGLTGDFLGVAAEGHGMRGPVGLTFAPGGNLFVGAALSNTILEFTLAGDYVRTLSTGATHRNATGLVFGSDGLLYVSESVTNEITRFDAGTGAFLGRFASGGGLNTPIYSALAPDGGLLVGSFATDSVIRYSADGLSATTFIAGGAGGLDGTHDIVFMPVPGPGDAALGVILTAFLPRRRPRRLSLSDR